MTTELVVSDKNIYWSPKPGAGLTPRKLKEITCGYLDIATTAFGRATHYSTREEVETVERNAHAALLGLDRDLYVAFLTLPGVTDRSRQLGVRNLLAQHRNGVSSFLNGDIERGVVIRLMGDIPPQRVLKLFETFIGHRKKGVKGVNNNRTRKLILRTLLRSSKFDWWAVKYRSKVCASLTHAWGQKPASILRTILSKPPSSWVGKDRDILRNLIWRWVAADSDMTTLYESVGFALGSERSRWSHALFRAFDAAKQDLSAGKSLPMEVLEGIRSQYHPSVSKDEVIRLCAPKMSKGQKMATQKRANEAGVKVDMDPMDYDPVRLYLYAYEMGMNPQIQAALERKAKAAAKGFPLPYQNIAIILDTSKSMEGSAEQHLRPISIAQALRDMLVQTSAGGAQPEPLLTPSGDTSLADSLLTVVSAQDPPDAVYVISDGYENTPAGRFAEVVGEMKKIGMNVPIFHFNPVVAAESKGVRELAPGLVPTMPVQKPDGLGVSLLRGLIEQDAVRGINALLGLTHAVKMLPVAQPIAVRN